MARAALLLAVALATVSCSEERTFEGSEPIPDLAGPDAGQDGPVADAAPADAPATDAPAADAPAADAPPIDAPPVDAPVPDTLADGPGCPHCPGDRDPVCGADGKTYANDCFASCVGVLLACLGECPCPGCNCPRTWDPVCGSDGDTHSNTCMAECFNSIVACEGECPCEEPCDPLLPETCPEGYACRCGGPGATQTCMCGLECSEAADCTNLNQTECCDNAVCTDPCTCYCE